MYPFSPLPHAEYKEFEFNINTAGYQDSTQSLNQIGEQTTTSGNTVSSTNMDDDGNDSGDVRTQQPASGEPDDTSLSVELLPTGMFVQ